VLAGVLVASVGAGTSAHAKGIATAGIASPSAKCKGGSVSAVVGGAHVCLKAGQKCKARYQPAYKKKGFNCVKGRLQKASAAKPQISIADATMPEGNSGTTPMSFDVTLSSPATQTVSVSYATADGNATAGSDYTSANGTLTFKAGEKSKTINVSIVGDTAVEPDETFTVNLSNPVNATIAKGSATGTIQNDDHAVAQPGNYTGTDSQNELFAFTVNPDGLSLTNLHTGQINESCNGGVSLYGGNLDFGSYVVPISGDGKFSVNASGTGTVGGAPSTYVIAIAGQFSGASASGTLTETDSFSLGGSAYTCTTGTVTWSANKT